MQMTLEWVYAKSSEEDYILIKSLHEFKGYGAKRLMKEFPTK